MEGHEFMTGVYKSKIDEHRVVAPPEEGHQEAAPLGDGDRKRETLRHRADDSEPTDFIDAYLRRMEKEKGNEHTTFTGQSRERMIQRPLSRQEQTRRVLVSLGPAATGLRAAHRTCQEFCRKCVTTADRVLYSLNCRGKDSCSSSGKHTQHQMFHKSFRFFVLL